MQKEQAGAGGSDSKSRTMSKRDQERAEQDSIVERRVVVPMASTSRTPRPVVLGYRQRGVNGVDGTKVADQPTVKRDYLG